MSLRLGGRRGGDAGGEDRSNNNGRGGMAFSFDYGSNPQSPLKRVTLNFDRDSGELLGTDTFASLTPGDAHAP